MIRPTDAQRLAERERPPSAPSMLQTWAQLLFLHWKWEPAEIQRTLPPGLTVDVHDGHAWLGLVPFVMEGVRPRGYPAVPGISDFLELNVHTYVHDAMGRPGVWFYSLDANKWIAVKLGRSLYYLPYEHATISATMAENGEVDYRAQRAGTPRESRFTYRPKGKLEDKADVGSLKFFLVERYRLFAQDARRDRLLTSAVHHQPYQTGAAEVTNWDAEILKLAGFDVGSRAPDHACMAQAVDVEVWPPEQVVAATPAPVEKEEGLGGAAAAPA